MRAVDVYRVEPWGLYMARPTPGRPQFHYLESWLLPTIGLRASIFHFNPGHERDQDFYLDVGRFTTGERSWTSEDHYLDLVVRSGKSVELEDVDELLDAVRHHLLSTDDGKRAITRATAAIEGLAQHNYQLGNWLASLGMSLTWRDR